MNECAWVIQLLCIAVSALTLSAAWRIVRGD